MFDRNIDFLTPFLTQYNFQGEIDDLYGVRGNGVYLHDFQDPYLKKGLENFNVILLNDQIFDDIKDERVERAI